MIRLTQDFQLFHASLWSRKAVYLSSQFIEASVKPKNSENYQLVDIFLSLQMY